MPTPLSGLTYGSRFDPSQQIETEFDVSYSTLQYTGFIGGGALQYQELNELQEQFAFQSSVMNEFAGNWLSILPGDKADESPIYGKSINTKITYINPYPILTEHGVVNEGYYLYDMSYFLNIGSLSITDESNAFDYLKNNIKSQIVTPYDSSPWKQILEDDNPDTLQSEGSHRKRYYLKHLQMLCPAGFHPNIPSYVFSYHPGTLSLEVIRSSIECTGNFIVGLTYQAEENWIELQGSNDNSMILRDDEFNGGLTAGITLTYSQNTMGTTRTAKIDLRSDPTDTSGSWPSKYIKSINIKQSNPDYSFSTNENININGNTTSFNVPINLTPNNINYTISATASDWIQPPNETTGSNIIYVPFTCDPLPPDLPPETHKRYGEITFSFNLNGYLIDTKKVQVTQIDSEFSMIMNLPRQVDLDIYGFSIVKSKYPESIDSVPNFNLPYAFGDEADYTSSIFYNNNAGSIDNYRDGTILHRIPVTTPNPRMCLQTGSLGRFPDWSFWTDRAGSTYTRVELTIDDNSDEVTLGDIVYYFGGVTHWNGNTANISPDYSAIITKITQQQNPSGLKLTLKTQTDIELDADRTVNMPNGQELTPIIDNYQNEIGYLNTLNELQSLGGSQYIWIQNTTYPSYIRRYEYRDLSFSRISNISNDGSFDLIPDNERTEFIKEMRHRVAFMPRIIEGNSNDLQLSVLDLGDHARKTLGVDQFLSTPPYSQYRYYDWDTSKVKGSIKQTLMSGFFGNFLINTSGYITLPIGGYVQPTVKTRRWYELIRLFKFFRESTLSKLYTLAQTECPEQLNNPNVMQFETVDGATYYTPLKLFEISPEIRPFRIVSGDQVNDQVIICIDEDTQLHGFINKSSAVVADSITPLSYHYFSPDWFAQHLIDEDGMVLNGPTGGFVRVVAAGGHNTQQFFAGQNVPFICWALHESGKLYGIDIGSSIFKSCLCKGISYHIELKTRNEILNTPFYPYGTQLSTDRVTNDLLKDEYHNFLNTSTTKQTDYIRLLLNMIPKVNGKRIPVIDIVGGYRNTSGFFVCALPPASNTTIDYGMNQKIQFVFPILEMFKYDANALYSKLKTWNINFRGSSVTDFEYVINTDMDTDLYDKLFKTYVDGENSYYYPPRCYGYNSYTMSRFWILTNNGIFASS